MDPSTLGISEQSYELLVWAVGGNAKTLHYLALVLFVVATTFFLLRCWREMYTVIDTLNKIWVHIAWSVLYGGLFFLCAVQAYYQYVDMFGPLSDLRGVIPPELLPENFGVLSRLASWLPSARAVFSE